MGDRLAGSADARIELLRPLMVHEEKVRKDVSVVADVVVPESQEDWLDHDHFCLDKATLKKMARHLTHA